MKTILLTGAAGSVGYETLKQLLDTDYSINVIELPSKRTKSRLNKYKERINIFYGSITDEKLVSEAIKGVDVVIHLAAIIPPLADQKPELTRQVNFFGTKNIINTIKKDNKNIFLLYSSSVSIYGDRINNPWIKVGDPLKPSKGDYYALTKIETERLIQESNINYSIFRLTGIMGRPDTDPLMFHMPLETKLEIATVEDTARAFIKAVLKTKELNHNIYNLGGGESCRTTYKDFLTNMFSLYGLNSKYMKEAAFAEKNFHCGYYLDSDELNKILNFRQDTLDSYYKRIDKNTNLFVRFMTKIFSRPILYTLNKKSEPLQAIKKKDSNLIKRFFNHFN